MSVYYTTEGAKEVYTVYTKHQRHMSDCRSYGYKSESKHIKWDCTWLYCTFPHPQMWGLWVQYMIAHCSSQFTVVHSSFMVCVCCALPSAFPSGWVELFYCPGIETVSQSICWCGVYAVSFARGQQFKVSVPGVGRVFQDAVCFSETACYWQYNINIQKYHGLFFILGSTW